MAPGRLLGALGLLAWRCQVATGVVLEQAPESLRLDAGKGGGAPWTQAARSDVPEGEICWIAARLNSALARQIHGMITMMALHGMRVPGKNATFKFDASDTGFRFQFQWDNETANASRVMKNALAGFRRDFCSDCVPEPEGRYTKAFGENSQRSLLEIMSHEKCLDHTTFVFDGAAYGFANPDHTKTEYPAMLERIKALAPLFTKTIRELPVKDIFAPQGRNVVLHLTDIRTGGNLPAMPRFVMGQRKIFSDSNATVLDKQLDLMRGILLPYSVFSTMQERPQDPRLWNAIKLARGDTKDLVNLIVHSKLSRETYYMLYQMDIHPAACIGPDNVPTLLALSQMIHADVLIGGEHGFAYNAAMLRDQDPKTVLIPELDWPMLGAPERKFQDEILWAPHTLY